ncbi:MAG TPA: dihydroorotate dehydrogenase-like protein [Deinococcales bacterium]|nr:dihydroorotate dehydrogenase-like protein [Deinococcales bacterium]
MDLATTYLGLSLKHPLVASASPLSRDLDGIRRLEDAGIAAVVLPSLFEEQINRESILLNEAFENEATGYAESTSMFPDLLDYNSGTEGYLDLIRKAKAATNIPVVASLNGTTPGGWTNYAKEMEAAGADAIELNAYAIHADILRTGDDVEAAYMALLREVRHAVKVPVAMKLHPYFSSLANTAWQLSLAGANGLVLFNRFYQPDINLELLEVNPTLNLSTSADLRLPLRWTAILHGRVSADIAISGGVHNHHDVLKGLMAGARVTMMASELLAHGVNRIPEILEDMTLWMEGNGYASVKQMQGSMSQKNAEDPSAFERANYIKVLKSYRAVPA